jgi:predicted permease
MRWFYKFPLRLRALFRHQRVEQDLHDEIEFHLQSQAEDFIARGIDPEEARYAALRSLGGRTRIEEECRESRGVSFIEDFLQDLRFGFRMMWRNPGFSLIAVLCLTLGIGANAAVFSWIEGLLLRPFPAVAHQDRLVVMVGTRHATRDKGGNGAGYEDISWPDFLDFQRNTRLFDAFIADKIMGTTLSIGDKAERMGGSVVSSNYFDALGVRPMLGRGFEPTEEVGRNAHPVTVISYWVWNEKFHRDPGVIGKTQVLNGVPHTIIGVAPKGFYGTFVGIPIQFWVPVSMQEVFEPGGYKLEDRNATWIEGFARLKPGVTIAQAQEELSAVAKRLETDYPETNRGRGVQLLPLWKAPFNGAEELLPVLSVALAVVFFVLLIACANVSNLLLVRSFARQHEMSVRLAIGAGRRRLVRQLLTEGLIISVLAAAGGILAAWLCRGLLVAFSPSRAGAAMVMKGEIDWRVLVVSAGIAVISTLIFGLAPAIRSGEVDLAGSLKSESGSVFGARGKSRIRSLLVVAQVCLSFVLLVGAVLFIQSMRRIQSADPGFSTTNVLTTAFDLVGAGYDTQRAKTFQDRLIERVRAIPGVESAALARVRPFSYSTYFEVPIAVDGYQPAPDELPKVEYNQVGPDYFRTNGIPLLSGREFNRADDENAALVAIVNEKMVSQYWKGEDPIGKRLQLKDRSLRVIGVARMSKYGSFSEPQKPFFYVPMRQDFSIRTTLNIRTVNDPKTVAAALAREVHVLDENLAPGEVITMREHVNRMALASQQAAVALLTIFGALALSLAAIGLYGVMSYSVSQSRREFGLRMALGAKMSDLIRLVLSHGLGLTAVGIILGGVVALSSGQLMKTLLYKVDPRNPVAIGVALLVMVLAALAACFVPAWRATRVDPVRALRD